MPEGRVHPWYGRFTLFQEFLFLVCTLLDVAQLHNVLLGTQF